MKKPIRLAGPALLTNSAATKYTNTAGEITVLTHVHVSNPGGGSAATFFLSIGTDAAGTRLFDAYSIAAGAVLDHWCKYPLTGTENIQAYSGTNNVLTLTLGGDLIQLG